MTFQFRSLLVPAILAVSIASAFSAETIKKDAVIILTPKKLGTKSNVKNNLVKPGPGTGADEHGCIPPQIWHAASGTCITDLIKTNDAEMDSKE